MKLLDGWRILVVEDEPLISARYLRRRRSDFQVQDRPRGPAARDRSARLYNAKAPYRNRSVVWQSNEAEAHILRRRVMKGGKIYLNGRTASIDCAVRGLSPEGRGWMCRQPLASRTSSNS
jgi:hypothetical protein